MMKENLQKREFFRIREALFPNVHLQIELIKDATNSISIKNIIKMNTPSREKKTR